MTTGNDATTERIAVELTQPLADLGFDLEAIEVSPAGKRRMLRIAVDRDGGITLDDVATATRAINETLDESNVMGEQPYTLEVTSRGVDRPLTLPRHWRRNADRLVKVTLHQGAPITGRILSSDDETVTLTVSGRQRKVAFAEIARALVQIEFNRPASSASTDSAEIDPEELDVVVGEDLDDEFDDDFEGDELHDELGTDDDLADSGEKKEN